ncbi:MAG: hypothetical protein PHX05_09080 [Acidobacteriota bacterium]|nr:hypothetical protein [Acidobacteriota bacterium]
MKKLLFLGLIFCFAFTAFAGEKVTRLGMHPFYKSRDLKAADLKVIALDKAGAVKQGFEQAGNGELVFAFLEQIQKADVQTVEMKPGDTVKWMMFKKNRKVVVMNDVVWAGKKPLTAYTFTIFRDGKLYEFIVPKICGNISLKNVSDVPAPVCNLKVEPAESVLGTPVKIDMCGAQNAVKTVVTVTDAAGAVVKTMELTPENCSAELTLDKVGEYMVAAVVEGQYGMKSPAGCEAAVKVTEPAPVVVPPPPPPAKKFGTVAPLAFLLEGGPAVLKGTYTGALWARGGVLVNLINDTLDAIFTVGGGVPIKGAPWKSFLMGNALLNLQLDPAYVGLGLGFSTKDCDREFKKGGMDLVGQLGINLFRHNKSTGSLFGELRAPIITKDRSFEHNHKLLLGFRYIF